MLTTSELLEPVARRRTDEVVITTMSTVRPWARVSDHDLDFASADSAMGHAADFALGLALARPERRVLCFNGDGSMLMTLGTLATIAGTEARNLVLFVVDNGGFEITGHQALAGAVDYAAMAKAAGFPRVYAFSDVDRYEAALDDILREPGPTMVHARVSAGSEGPISRTESERARYLTLSLAQSVRKVRGALWI